MSSKGKKQIRPNPSAQQSKRKHRATGKPAYRPPGTGYHPDAKQREVVETMAGLGLPQDQIALLIINPATGQPISETTLKVHFHHELQAGIAKANAHVMGNLYRHTKDKHGAAIFWARARRLMSDRPYFNPGGSGGDQPGMTPEQMTELETARRVAFMLEQAVHTRVTVVKEKA